MPAGSKNAPEAQAREKIDRLLEDAGWIIQDRDDMNVSLPAVAVREFKLDKGHGFADYLLFLDGKARRDPGFGSERPAQARADGRGING